ncbi:MAG TPA: acetoacetate decarboxylase family protein, partial [Chthonomonadaceae bacterium]|nr:acetoacetate decarboxylase family protein [Chthonomonadaceae bacterium]
MGDRESEDRGYPAPPWHLQGAAFPMLQVVDSRRARLFVPYGLKIVSLWPGKTLGGLILASYGPGSDLEYNELIAFPALVRRGLKWGVWISHIYVDDDNSLLGGREIWGLPKQWAEFTREEPGRIIVRKGEEVLCALE